MNNSGAVINTSNEVSPADTFDSTKSYYGMFDPLRCYTTDSNSFNYGSVKVSLSDERAEGLTGTEISSIG